jgi:hypothetical protein
MSCHSDVIAYCCAHFYFHQRLEYLFIVGGVRESSDAAARSVVAGTSRFWYGLKGIFIWVVNGLMTFVKERMRDRRLWRRRMPPVHRSHQSNRMRQREHELLLLEQDAVGTDRKA